MAQFDIHAEGKNNNRNDANYQTLFYIVRLYLFCNQADLVALKLIGYA